jgi:hypothetical protein
MRHHKIILCLILIGGFLARMTLLDFPLISEETTRDQLIASHIVRFGEFPLFGPNNGTLPSVGNSPLYYYLVGIPYLFSAHPMGPGLFNLILQTGSIYFIYLITKKLFGEKAAIFSTLLSAFANIFVITSVWMWQPYLMSFFLITSIYFLVSAGENGKKSNFILSLGFFIISMAVHMSVAALFPFYISALFYLSLKKRVGVKGFFLLGIAGAAFFLACNTNIISSRFFPDISPTISVTQRFVQNTGEYLNQVVYNSRIILSSFGNPTITLELIGVFMILAFTVRKKTGLKLYLLATTVGFLMISALINDRLWDQHFYPFFIILVILLGSGAAATEKSHLFTKTVFYITAALFVIGAAGTKISITDTVWVKNISFPRFEKLNASEKIGKILAAEVDRIRTGENFNDNSFFGFRTYTTEENRFYLSQTHLLDSPYWLSLEREMDYKFVSIKNLGMETVYVPPQKREYIFVSCLYYSGKEAENDCLRQFSEEESGYKIIKDLDVNYYGHSFYLAKSQGKD